MEWLSLVWVALGVVVLLVLNMKFKLNSFLSLLIVAFLVGILIFRLRIHSKLGVYCC